MITRWRLTTPVLLLAAVALLGVASAARGTLDPGEPGMCNRDAARAPGVQFELAAASELRDRMPNALRMPELDGPSAEVTVVVFEGPHHAVPVFGGLHPDGTDGANGAEGVVCVVFRGSGEAIYYADVDTSGLDLGGLSVDRFGE